MTEVAGLFLQVAELSVSAAWMIPAVCALNLIPRAASHAPGAVLSGGAGAQSADAAGSVSGIAPAAEVLEPLGLTNVLAALWLAGLAAMLLYALFKLAAPTSAGAGGRPGRGWEIYLRQAARPIYTRTVPPVHISAFGFVGAGAGLRPGAREGAPEAEGPYLEAIGLAAAERPLVQPSCLAGLRAVLPRCGVCL